MREPVQLTALLKAYQFTDTPPLLAWFKAHGANVEKTKANVIRGRWAPRKITWHWVVEKADAQRLLSIREQELPRIPAGPRAYTIAEAAKKLGITPAQMEAMVLRNEVDVLVDGFWIERYLARGSW